MWYRSVLPELIRSLVRNTFRPTVPSGPISILAQATVFPNSLTLTIPEYDPTGCISKVISLERGDTGERLPK